MSTLAWACCENGWWLHSKISPVWRISAGKAPQRIPLLRYKDICKQHLKALGMDLNRWETLTSEQSAWRQAVQHGLSQFEEALVQQAKAKRQSQNQQNQGAGQGTDCICLQYGRDCHSWIGLLSHTRHCSKTSRYHSLSSLKDAYKKYPWISLPCLKI